MMTDTERQLQARLGPALDGLTTRPAPLAAIVRDGRRVKVRKRISLAAGLVAVAAAVTAAILAVPSLLSGSTSVPPLTTHYHVTVSPPAPHSPPGLIASGRVNGVPWSLRVTRNSNGYFFAGIGAGFFLSTGAGSPLPGRYAHGDPVSPVTQSAAALAFGVAAVRADVTLVEVRLTNGQALSLRPVAAADSSLVVFAVPDFRDVLAIEAFNRRGEIGYTVPWTGHLWFMTDRWLKPDQPAAPRPQTAVIGSGTAFGRRWSELVGVGPWGWCGQAEIAGDGGAGGCSSVLPPLPAGRYYQATGFAGGSAIGQSGLISSAQVADSVALVELTTRSGQHTWIRPHRVGGQSFVSFVTAVSGTAPQTVTRWAVYDRHHHLLASGSA